MNYSLPKIPISIDKTLNWLLLGYIFLLPWQTALIFNERYLGGAKWQAGSGVLFATEILLWLIAGLFIFDRIKYKSGWRMFQRLSDSSQQSYGPKSRFTFSLWLFLLYAGLSIIWSADQLSAQYAFFHLLEAAALLFIILDSKIKPEQILWTLSAGACLQGLIAIGEFAWQNVPAAKWLGLASHNPRILGDIVINSPTGRVLRAYGSFPHPNILGGFAAIGLIATFRLDQKGSQHKILLPLCQVIIAAGLFFSFSRSAWLALATAITAIIVLLIHDFRSAEKFRSLKLLAIPLAVFALLIVAYSNLLFARADLSDRLENISAQERVGQLGQAANIIKAHPLLGVGINNYTVELANQNPSLPAYCYQPVHNVFLLLTAEFGLLGLMIIFLSAYNLALLLAKSPDITLALSFMPAVLIIACLDHYLWTSYFGLMLGAVLLTILLKYDKLTSQQ